MFYFEAGSYVSSTVRRSTDLTQKVHMKLPLILVGFEDKY